jgi:myo-inositol catabolism protein IolC
MRRITKPRFLSPFPREIIMSLGYNRPLYLLPFDHRHSYLTGMFHVTPPLTADQHEQVVESKLVIYDGFRRAVGRDVPVASAGILVDEEFGADILRDAARNGFVTALSTEKSGSEEFEFEYGMEFEKHIEAFKPTFAKALVRYNPEGDAALNRRQTIRLRQLSAYCQASGQKFMFELLVPATEAQKNRVRAEAISYDQRVRPDLVVQTIRTLQDAGVEPDIWKVEGLHSRDDCERVVAIARRDGRDEVACIVLGRGADKKKVASWLQIAASVSGFIGFAVGRTTFWDAIADFVAKSITRDEAASRIAQRYSNWAAIFEGAHRPEAILG